MSENDVRTLRVGIVELPKQRPVRWVHRDFQPPGREFTALLVHVVEHQEQVRPDLLQAVGLFEQLLDALTCIETGSYPLS